MLSNRVLALAARLAVLPQMVHAAKGVARCVDASAPASSDRYAPEFVAV
jgi:hypothetical protein